MVDEMAPGRGQCRGMLGAMTSLPQRTGRSLAREIRMVSRPGDDGAPLYRRLYRQLRAHVLSGQLAPGTRLPSARTLASDLRVSRNTVEAAMAQLVDEGFVERRVGAGTVVSASVGEAAPFAPAARATVFPASEAPPRRVRLSRRGESLLALGRVEIDGDTTTGLCATNLQRFPLQAWTRLLARRARRAGTSLLVPSDPLGLPELRREIAHHASLTRGLRCSEQQVLVVGSTQEAIDLAARVMLDPGDTVLMEDPGYRSARAALLGAGARVAPVPVDAHGLVTSALPRRGRARLVYVTPSHQYPLGVEMTLARRLELLRWADERDVWVIEDDYDSEFRHDGRPIAALQSLRPDGRVLYVGTYNKVLFPGLRLAYLILPGDWTRAFAAARRVASGSWSPLPQAVLAEFIASGRFATFLRQARQFYARSRDCLVDAIAEHWGDAVTTGPASTGLHLVAGLPERADDAALARRARTCGLSAAALSGYYHALKPRRGLVLFYGASTPDALAAGVRAFAKHLR